MKKIYSFVVLLSLFSNLLFGTFVFASESNFISKDITFEIGSQSGLNNLILDTNSNTFSIIFGVIYNGNDYVRINTNLPLGLVANSFEIVSENGSRCLKTNGLQEIDNSSIIQTNSNFSYSFKGNGFCEAIVKATYVTNGLSIGTHNISYGYFEYSDVGLTTMIHNNASPNISLAITNDIVLNQAFTLDNNSNGLIDGLDLRFNKSFDKSAFDLGNINSKLSIGLLNGGVLNYSLSNNTGVGTGLIVSFNEQSNWNSGIKPQISLQAFSNIGENFYNISNLIPIDSSNPVLLSINNGSAIAGTDNIVFKFSEQMNDSITLSGITLKDKNNILINFPISSNVGNTIYTLNSNTTLYSDKNPYTYYISGVSDWAGNILNLTGSINIVQNVCSITSVSNGSVSAFPDCIITCNSGYTKSGDTCISSGGSGGSGGGGGGGGGVPPTCLDSQLECRSYLNSYVWQLKSGVSCQGGNLAKACDINNIVDITNSGSINTNGGQSGGSGSIISEVGNLILQEVRKYLIENLSTRLTTLINTYGNKIDFKNINYLRLLDKELNSNYNALILSYKNLFENINLYLQNKDKNLIVIIRNNLNDYQKYYNLTKEPENKYITKINLNGIIIYQTKNEQIKIVMGKIENIILAKYKKLLLNQKIDYVAYNKAIENYNNFVLYLSIFRIIKDDESKNMGKYYLGEVIKIYSFK